MSESNTRSVRLMESYTTYECHGDININLDIFPELKDKTNEEIEQWLNDNYCSLYVHCGSGEIRKDMNYVYEPEDLEEGEVPELFEDSDVVELAEYWSNTEVVWDKIKGEEKTLHVK